MPPRTGRTLKHFPPLSSDSIRKKQALCLFATPPPPIYTNGHQRGRTYEPLAKLWMDERQSRFETIVGKQAALSRRAAGLYVWYLFAWWFHGPKFQLGQKGRRPFGRP